MENSSQGLTLLDPDRRVVVTGEERHRAALVRYAPRADGRPRRVAVELRRTAAGRIEVLLDGRRVGELTALMSRRYAAHVDAVARRGGRPGAVGLVVAGRRGVEMELRLPEVSTAEAAAPLPPASPRPTPRGPEDTRPPARARGRLRPVVVGAGVFALVVAVGAAVGGGEEDVRDTATPAVSAAPPSLRSSPDTSTPRRSPSSTTTTPSPSPSPRFDPDREPVRAPSATVTRPPQTPIPEPEPAPEPRRLVAPEPEPARDCHPSYSGCLPIGPDLDCADIDGSVRVVGPDEYRLDRDDDGVGCES